MLEFNLPIIMAASFLAVASPGPATLAIAGVSMGSHRKYGLAVALGISTGSLIWLISAAVGLAGVMAANVWLFETLRYAGGAYLLFLAYKSAKSAYKAKPLQTVEAEKDLTFARAFRRGLMIHLTNPKALLFVSSLYTIGVPGNAGIETIALVCVVIAIQNALIFHGYALLFSSTPMVKAYVKMKRGFETVFAAAFGFAAFKILTTRL